MFFPSYFPFSKVSAYKLPQITVGEMKAHLTQYFLYYIGSRTPATQHLNHPSSLMLSHLHRQITDETLLQSSSVILFYLQVSSDNFSSFSCQGPDIPSPEGKDIAWPNGSPLSNGKEIYHRETQKNLEILHNIQFKADSTKSTSLESSVAPIRSGTTH